MTNLSPVGGNVGVKSNYPSFKLPATPNSGLSQTIPKNGSSKISIKGKNIKHQSGTVYQLKNGWYVKIFSPFKWCFKFIAKIFCCCKKSKNHTALSSSSSTTIKVTPPPHIITPIPIHNTNKVTPPPKPAHKTNKVTPQDPATPKVKISNTLKPSSKKPTPQKPPQKAKSNQASFHHSDVASAIKKGNSDEIVAKVRKMHEDVLKGAYDAESLTELHIMEEKAATKLETVGKLKEAWEVRALAAQIPVFEDHPLSDLEGPPFGTYGANLGNGVVKGGTVHGIMKAIDHMESEVFTFKINYPTRAKLTQTLNNVYTNLPAFEKSLPPEFTGGATTAKENFVFIGRTTVTEGGVQKEVFSESIGLDTKESSIRVTFNHILTDHKGPYIRPRGHVIVGANEGCVCLHNTITVGVDSTVPKEERLQTAQAMVAMLGLGPVFGAQLKEDEERIKVAQLYRTYYPTAAYDLERQADFYEMPVAELKKRIESKTSAMKQKWSQLDTMVEEEIYPGKKVWCVPTIADQMRQKGAMGLMAGIHDNTIDQCADTACMILKNGALSSQDRYQIGLFKKGASTAEDFKTGGGDSVFTRLITESLEKSRHGIYLYQGSIQVLYDLDVVNRGSYGYASDQYGTRGVSVTGHPTNTYKNRSNLIDLVSQVQMNNEIMVKNRIDPSHIRGFVVQDKYHKETLIKKLKAANLVDAKGKINGKLVDDFVHVASKFTKNMWE